MNVEKKTYGFNACWKLAEHRPEDLVRVYLLQSRVREFSNVLRFCAQNKRAYHIVSAAELEKVSGSKHHEGICILARIKPALSLREFRTELTQLRSPLVLLEGVENPHNVGAILRLSAHFGVQYLLVNQDQELVPAGSTARIAEGGAEVVRLVKLSTTLEALRLLKKHGYQVVATTPHTDSSLYEHEFPEKCAFVLGSEAAGLSAATIAASDAVVRIPGSGVIESLSVTSAAALTLGEYWRQQRCLGASK